MESRLDGVPMHPPHRLEIRGLDQALRPGRSRHRPRPSTSNPAASPGSSAPTAPARPPPSGCSSASSLPTRAPPSSADARYRDLPDPPRTVGAVLDASNFHPARTGRDHLRVYADMLGCPGRPRRRRSLALTGIAHAADRRAGGYSTGMRQRLNLATALLGDPPVLVLDEPTNGLDPEGIAWLRRLLRDLAAGGPHRPRREPRPRPKPSSSSRTWWSCTTAGS